MADVVELQSGELVVLSEMGPVGPPGATGPAGADGAAGPTGPTGATGAGVPVGGATGQVLKKVSATDFDTVWGSAAALTFQLDAAGTAIIPVDNADSWVVGSDRMDNDVLDTTKHMRAFFNKVKGAFRAGGTWQADTWDDAKIGSYSSAFGYNTTASNTASHAEGQSTTATGLNAHSEGYETLASGGQAHAEGWHSHATGAQAHAEGQQTKATGGNGAHSEGNGTIASGSAAHAEGSTTTASGHSSHAEGNGTTASGSQAHAEGGATRAEGPQSHAEGSNTTATGSASHAGGFKSSSPRLGQRSRASGSFDFSARGDAQEASMVLFKSTADATATVLTAEAGVVNLTGLYSTNVLTLPASHAYQLKISTVARRTDVQGEAAGWTWDGVVNRDATGAAYIVGTPIIAAWGAAGSAAWDLTVSIDTTDVTNNYVAVTATGEALKTIRWVAKLEWTEVGG